MRTCVTKNSDFLRPGEGGGRAEARGRRRPGPLSRDHQRGTSLLVVKNLTERLKNDRVRSRVAESPVSALRTELNVCSSPGTGASGAISTHRVRLSPLGRGKAGGPGVSWLSRFSAGGRPGTRSAARKCWMPNRRPRALRTVTVVSAIEKTVGTKEDAERIGLPRPTNLPRSLTGVFSSQDRWRLQ